MESPVLQKPDKTHCAQCGQSESATQSLRRCGKCRTVPYCSIKCQKAAWKSHKQVCALYLLDNTMNYAGVYVGQKPPKLKKGAIKRTRGHISKDLQTYAISHSGTTLTVSAWYLLELNKDISRARTHFLALTLRRTASSNPRTLYSLIDAEVIQWSYLESVWANRANFLDLSPVSPKSMLEADEAAKKRNGALGSVMVISIELPEGDNQPPREALKTMNVHTLQPLGLYKEHKNTISRLPLLPKEVYMQCLKNALDGGAYTTRFQPYTPMDS